MNSNVWLLKDWSVVLFQYDNQCHTETQAYPDTWPDMFLKGNGKAVARPKKDYK